MLLYQEKMTYLPIVLQKPNNAKSRDQMIPAAFDGAFARNF
ncbi:hypothetical protein BBR47_30260 [Brevibacillus brevis NBRC 100599]|uniref:Uncharacterized protein n=1 Tax=Brevibacillus brevis (strain 47 / JCM 6285 / NBRC 100599) TaxID=358681 RepID=C0ZDZ4_BREBN|nr:hypothetical protein BBR47_30260 [Brevibacillus brevis NBRC 100599]